MKIFNISQRTAALIQWLLHGTSRDKDRTVLRRITRYGNDLIAADGFALYGAKVPDDWPEDVGAMEVAWLGRPRTYLGLPSANKRLLVAEVEEKPVRIDLSDTRPQSEPIFHYAVNPKLLMAILKDLDTQGVILTFYGQDKPMEVRTRKDDGERYALLMPMHIDWFIRGKELANLYVPEALNAKVPPPPADAPKPPDGGAGDPEPHEQPQG